MNNEYERNQVLMNLVFLLVCVELRFRGMITTILWKFMEGLAAVKG